MNINIKNMVCKRCIMVVGQIFENAGVNDSKVQLGKVTLESEITEEQLE